MAFGLRGGSTTANPTKISLSQFCTMSTFHMAQALLLKIVLDVSVQTTICLVSGGPKKQIHQTLNLSFLEHRRN
jgi:hypothetical protein